MSQEHFYAPELMQMGGSNDLLTNSQLSGKKNQKGRLNSNSTGPYNMSPKKRGKSTFNMFRKVFTLKKSASSPEKNRSDQRLASPNQITGKSNGTANQSGLMEQNKKPIAGPLRTMRPNLFGPMGPRVGPGKPVVESIQLDDIKTTVGTQSPKLPVPSTAILTSDQLKEKYWNDQERETDDVNGFQSIMIPGGGRPSFGAFSARESANSFGNLLDKEEAKVELRGMLGSHEQMDATRVSSSELGDIEKEYEKHMGDEDKMKDKRDQTKVHSWALFDDDQDLDQLQEDMDNPKNSKKPEEVSNVPPAVPKRDLPEPQPMGGVAPEELGSFRKNTLGGPVVPTRIQVLPPVPAPVNRTEGPPPMPMRERKAKVPPPMPTRKKDSEPPVPPVVPPRRQTKNEPKQKNPPPIPARVTKNEPAAVPPAAPVRALPEIPVQRKDTPPTPPKRATKRTPPPGLDDLNVKDEDKKDKSGFNGLMMFMAPKPQKVRKDSDNPLFKKKSRDEEQKKNMPPESQPNISLSLLQPSKAKKSPPPPGLIKPETKNKKKKAKKKTPLNNLDATQAVLTNMKKDQESKENLLDDPFSILQSAKSRTQKKGNEEVNLLDISDRAKITNKLSFNQGKGSYSSSKLSFKKSSTELPQVKSSNFDQTRVKRDSGDAEKKDASGLEYLDILASAKAKSKMKMVKSFQNPALDPPAKVERQQESIVMEEDISSALGKAFTLPNQKGMKKPDLHLSTILQSPTHKKKQASINENQPGFKKWNPQSNNQKDLKKYHPV